MAALAGMGIDNLYIDVDASEMPIMDGSAKPFVDLIQTAGIRELDAPKKILRIKSRIDVMDGDKSASLAPSSDVDFKCTMTIDFDHPVIRNTSQKISLHLTEAAFVEQISKARTFGFLAEYENFRKNNLAKGASLENTVVVGDDRVMNEEGLRYPDEFVKHKLLDAIGDLYLLGHPIHGAFTAHKSGHKLNHQLREALIATPKAWELV